MRKRLHFKFIDLSQAEIQSDPLLSRYLLFLIGIHFLTAIYWFYQGFDSILSSIDQSYCWPFFSSCEAAKHLLLPVSPLLLPIYVSLSLLGFFQSLASPRRGWYYLLVIELIKLGYQSLDYRFMGNYHFMPHIITLFFLFLPQKRFWIRTWLITFYLAAASLKLNFEWLSGASLSWKVPFNSLALLPWMALGALMTEITAPILLTFKSRWPRIVACVLLVLFHLISYFWVGFFYPSIMLSLLAIFFMEFYFEPGAGSILKSHKSAAFLLSFSIWALFALGQIFSSQNARENALHGESRLFSLNMFDARTLCRGVFLIHSLSDSDREIVEVDFQNEDLSIRVRCDPIIFKEQARHLCQTKSQKVEKIEGYLISRQLSDYENSEIVKEGDICKKWQK
jgi:hypothetical protein